MSNERLSVCVRKTELLITPSSSRGTFLYTNRPHECSSIQYGPQQRRPTFCCIGTVSNWPRDLFSFTYFSVLSHFFCTTDTSDAQTMRGHLYHFSHVLFSAYMVFFVCVFSGSCCIMVNEEICWVLERRSSLSLFLPSKRGQWNRWFRDGLNESFKKLVSFVHDINFGDNRLVFVICFIVINDWVYCMY